MKLTNKQFMQLSSALHNTLEKTKAHIRRTNKIPSAENVFDWFQQLCESEIIKDKLPLDGSDMKSNLFEAIFFFNHLQVHLHLEFEKAEYRGRPYFNAPFHFTFINELDSNDIHDEEQLRYLKQKFNLKL